MRCLSRRSLSTRRTAASTRDGHARFRAAAFEVAVGMAGDIGSGGALTTGMIEQFEREAGEREVRAHRAVSEFCPREGLTMASSPTEAATRPSAEWHVETGQEPRWMTAYGISADLIVASRGSRDDAVLRSILETVLIETGRPLLIPSTVARSTPILDKIAIV